MTSIRESIDEYLTHLNKLSPHTQRAYRNSLNAFAKSYHLITEDFQVEAVQVFVRDTLSRQYSRSTANLYAVALRGFVNHLLADNTIGWTPAQLARFESLLDDLKPKKKKRLPKLPSEDNVSFIRQQARAWGLTSPLQERNVALIEVLYSTGCRIDEVVSLRRRDIDTKQQQARVIGKGDKERVVFLSPAAVNACLRYWYARQVDRPTPPYDHDPAFARHDDGAGKSKPWKRLTTQGARNVVLELAAKAEIEHFTPHSFRHYFATRMLRETNDLAMVQFAMGHESPETTKVYAKADPEMVRRAHKEVFGK